MLRGANYSPTVLCPNLNQFVSPSLHCPGNTPNTHSADHGISCVDRFDTHWPRWCIHHCSCRKTLITVKSATLLFDSLKSAHAFPLVITAYARNADEPTIHHAHVAFVVEVISENAVLAVGHVARKPRIAFGCGQKQLFDVAPGAHFEVTLARGRYKAQSVVGETPVIAQSEFGRCPSFAAIARPLDHGDAILANSLEHQIAPAMVIVITP